MRKYVVQGGIMREEDLETEGRKFPLKFIRKRTLEKYEKYMRSQPPVHYEILTEQAVESKLKSNS